MTELMVFDLQRFALHDGPGIRTTVFLKGCPLDCLWCHNPESKNRKPQLGFLEKNCSGCGACAEVCPRSVHSFAKEGKHILDYSKCIRCGACTEVCPSRQLKLYGKSMPSEEILTVVMKDIDFYERSGGGLTVSGGEPMMQYEGLLDLLKKGKERGLHICLDTSGQASGEKFREVARYVDVFLFDYKLTDPAEHKKYTGVDNVQILSNLALLNGLGSEIYLRCPIIPGINDHKEHYRKIAELSRAYEGIKEVNLMMYHDMARGKAAQIGEKYVLGDLKTMEEQERKNIYKLMESYGCLHLRQS